MFLLKSLIVAQAAYTVLSLIAIKFNLDAKHTAIHFACQVGLWPLRLMSVIPWFVFKIRSLFK